MGGVFFVWQPHFEGLRTDFFGGTVREYCGQQYSNIRSRIECDPGIIGKVHPLVQALMLCTGRTAHRGSKGIASL